LIKNRRLRRGKQELAFPVRAAVFAPALTRSPAEHLEDTPVLFADRQVLDFIGQMEWRHSDELFEELLSTLEGAKGLIRPSKRQLDDLAETSKGALAAKLEAEITTFDRRQREGAVTVFERPVRIRGLAGSGKTVVLAMKAALTHLRNPGKRILYTFWTKSLYQHVRRLITRFYRQFDDRDPDWTSLQVLHAWGGAGVPGVYSNACQAFGLRPLTFQEASAGSKDSPFGYACEQFLASGLVKPLYDYIFIDEGQDFPIPFMKLCSRLVSDARFVIAYDELQNIFQKDAPTAADIWGDTNKNFEDVVLHKCYRNPREVLVCAHALGFGIYGNRIVQMLENKEHWEDIGYVVKEGEFTTGSRTVIERPPENSLRSISMAQTIDELVFGKTFDDFDAETTWVCESIKEDIRDGLKPDDILVITCDDRNAKAYLQRIELKLERQGIGAHNIHTAYGQVDFQREDAVTLSTVHKAKGNESFMVYVVGIDALFPKPLVRHRNMLFTAMTRAKGWLRMTGVKPDADVCMAELSKARQNFPSLVFDYPSEDELKVMHRDLEESVSRRLRAERLLEQVYGEMSEDEIRDFLDKRKTKGRSKGDQE
jgi:superfamily I DNA and RNA helicase